MPLERQDLPRRTAPIHVLWTERLAWPLGACQSLAAPRPNDVAQDVHRLAFPQTRLVHLPPGPTSRLRNYWDAVDVVLAHGVVPVVRQGLSQTMITLLKDKFGQEAELLNGGLVHTVGKRADCPMTHFPPV